MRSTKGDFEPRNAKKTLLDFGKLFPDKTGGEGECFFYSDRQESLGFLNSSASSSGIANMVAEIICFEELVWSVIHSISVMDWLVSAIGISKRPAYVVRYPL